MTQLLINDIIDDIQHENIRLSNELRFANRCLQLFEKYRHQLALFSLNCNCGQNIDNKLKFHYLEEEYERIFVQKLSEDHNWQTNDACGHRFDVKREDIIVTHTTDQISGETVAITNSSALNIMGAKKQQSLHKLIDINRVKKKYNREIQLSVRISKNENNDNNSKTIPYELKIEACGNMFLCTFPNCTFAKKAASEVRKHIRRVHSADRPYKCNLCPNNYKSKGLLDRHQISHTGVKFRCDWKDCKFETMYLQSLTQHKLRHDGVMPFKCEIDGCGKSFTTKGNISEHHYRVHSNLRPFNCDWPECGSTFKSEHEVRIHRSVHTGEKKFKCFWPGCEYRSVQKNALDKHLLTHQEIKKYLCDWPECGKRFSTNYTLTNHMRLHRNERPFKCHYPQCDKCYPSNTKLLRHMKTHTETNRFLL